MKFGEEGSKLLKIIQAAQFSSSDEDLVKRVESENRAVRDKMRWIRETTGDDDVDEEISLNYMLLKNFLDRNVRILRTYRFARIQKIQSRVFQGREPCAGLQHLKLCRDIKNAIELRCSEFPFIDFVEGKPPLDLYVQILTLDDCGVVMDGDEFVELKKNRVYFLRRKAVDHLINMKLVEVIG